MDRRRQEWLYVRQQQQRIGAGANGGGSDVGRQHHPDGAGSSAWGAWPRRRGSPWLSSGGTRSWPGQAISLLMRSLPYALARFGILLGCAIACIIWIVIAFGGAAFLGNHIAGAFGFVWLLTLPRRRRLLLGHHPALRAAFAGLRPRRRADRTDHPRSGRQRLGTHARLRQARGDRAVWSGQRAVCLEPHGARRSRGVSPHARLGWRNLAHSGAGRPRQSRQHHPAGGHTLSRQSDPVVQPGARRRGTVAAARARAWCITRKTPCRF